MVSMISGNDMMGESFFCGFLAPGKGAGLSGLLYKVIGSLIHLREGKRYGSNNASQRSSAPT